MKSGNVLVSLVLAAIFSGSEFGILSEPCQAGPNGSSPETPGAAGPSVGGPAPAGPSLGGPSLGGPSPAGPSPAGPSPGGPSPAGPSLGGPSVRGSANGGPSASMSKRKSARQRGSYGSYGQSRVTNDPAATIEQQALDLHQRRAHENNSVRTEILKRAETEARQIKKQGDADASDYYWNYARRLRRRGWANEGAQEIKQEAANRAEQVMNRAREQSERYERDTRNHERTMREVSESLQSQMQPTGGKGVRINPKGTNLYIRNYSH